jgi:hypothetical protein
MNGFGSGRDTVLQRARREADRGRLRCRHQSWKRRAAAPSATHPGASNSFTSEGSQRRRTTTLDAAERASHLDSRPFPGAQGLARAPRRQLSVDGGGGAISASPHPRRGRPPQAPLSVPESPRCARIRPSRRPINRPWDRRVGGLRPKRPLERSDSRVAPISGTRWCHSSRHETAYLDWLHAARQGRGERERCPKG